MIVLILTVWPVTREPPSTFVGLVQLLCQIILVRHLFDRMELTFQPVDVVFFIMQDFIHQFARTVISNCDRNLYAVGALPPYIRVPNHFAVVA
jgi:hypothetical protein